MTIELFNYIITFYPIDYILIAFIGGIVILFFITRSTVGSKGQIAKSLNLSLFLISLPKETRKEGSEAQKNEKEMISVMEQFYASLINLKEKGWKNFLSGSSHLIFEIATAAGSDDIRFYVACPRRFADVLQKQIQSFYPTAEVESTEDYNIFNPQGAVSAAYLKLSRDWIWPIKTYQNLETDPLSGLTNSLSKIPEGEGAAIQVLIKPIKGWQKRVLSKVKEIQEKFVAQGKLDYEDLEFLVEHGLLTDDLLERMMSVGEEEQTEAILEQLEESLSEGEDEDTE